MATNIQIVSAHIGPSTPFLGMKFNSVHICEAADISFSQYGCTRVNQVGQISVADNPDDKWMVLGSTNVDLKTTQGVVNPSAVAGATPPALGADLDLDAVAWLDGSAAGQGAGGASCANKDGGSLEPCVDGSCTDPGGWICNNQIACINASRVANNFTATKPWYSSGAPGTTWSIPSGACGSVQSDCGPGMPIHGVAPCDCHSRMDCPMYHQNCGGTVVGAVGIQGMWGYTTTPKDQADNSYAAVLSPNGIVQQANCNGGSGDDTCFGGKFVQDVTLAACYDPATFYAGAATIPSKTVTASPRFTYPDNVTILELDNTPGSITKGTTSSAPADGRSYKLAVAETPTGLFQTGASAYVPGVGNVLYTPPVDLCMFTNWLKGLNGTPATPIRLDIGGNAAGPVIPDVLVRAYTFVLAMTMGARFMAINAFNYFGSWDGNNVCREGLKADGFADPNMDLLSDNLPVAIKFYQTKSDSYFQPLFQRSGRSDLYNQIKDRTDVDFFAQHGSGLFMSPTVCTSSSQDTICLTLTLPTDIAMSFLGPDGQLGDNHQTALNAFFGEGNVLGTTYPTSAYTLNSVVHYGCKYTNNGGVESFVASGTAGTVVPNKDDTIDMTNFLATDSCSFTFNYRTQLIIGVTNFSKMTLAYCLKWDVGGAVRTRLCGAGGGLSDIPWLPVACLAALSGRDPQAIAQDIVKYCTVDNSKPSSRYFDSASDVILGDGSPQCQCYLSRLGPETGPPANHTSICFSEACSAGGGDTRLALGYDDETCKKMCPTIKGWFNNKLVPPSSLNPADLDEGRLQSLCGYAPVFDVKLFNVKSLLPTCAFAVALTAITYGIMSHRGSKKAGLSAVFAAFIGVVVVVGLGILSAAGLTGCTPPYNPDRAPDLPLVECRGRFGIKLPEFLCSKIEVGCEAIPGGPSCPIGCTNHSGTCSPDDGSTRPTHTVRKRYMSLVIYYSIIAVLLAISYFATKSKLVIIALLFVVGMIIREAIGREMTTWAAPCGQVIPSSPFPSQ